MAVDSPVMLRAVTPQAPMPVVSPSGARAPALATALVRPTETGWPEPASLPGTTGGPMVPDLVVPDLVVPDLVVPDLVVPDPGVPVAAMPEIAVYDLTAPHPAARHPSAPQPSGTSWVIQIPYALALAGVAGGLVAIRQSTPHLRSGTLVLAGALLFAALARMVLPDRRAGMLSSRRRWLDTVIFAVFGAGLLVVALVVLPPS
ncbi:MAG: DUF3017 domain-containing protein [Streptosporangiaceae bacterium]